MNQSLKPNRRAFVQFSLLLSLATAALLFVLIYLGSRIVYRGPIPVFAFVGVGAVVALVLTYLWVHLNASHQKAEYVFQGDRLILRGGAIFSSFEQELVVKNITHVVYKKPFLEHWFHNTGHIYIQAAGGADVEVHMKSIDASETVYEQVLDMLRDNGFALTCDKEVYEEKPAPRGVWFQTAGILAVGGFVAFGIITGILEDVSKGKTKLYLGWEAYLFLLIVVVAVVIGVGYFHGLMSRYRYKLFEDAILARTDFFTVQETIIPMENLSDSTLTQGLLGRWIKISDLALSCQGSGHEVKFNFVENGQLWKNKLDDLIRQRTQRKQEVKEAAAAASSGPSVKDWKESKRPAIERDESFTQTLDIHRKRLFLVPSITIFVGIALLVLGGIFAQGIQRGGRPDPSQIFGMVMLGLGGLVFLGSLLRLIYGFVFVRAHSYEIKPTGFAKHFRFIITKDVIFQAEKITAVIVKEGIIDRMFGTCSIEFWSIGASDHLRYSFIPKDNDILQMILAKVGIHPKAGAKHREVLAQADPLRVMQMLMFVMVPLFLSMPILWMFVHPLASVGALLLIILPIISANVYYRFHKLTLFEDYLWFRKGIIKHSHYYVLYNDVKYVQTNLYPMTTAGTLTFEITGERVVKTQNGEIKLSNRFHVRFISDVRYHHLFLDLLFARELEWDQLPQNPSTMDNYKPRELHHTGPKIIQELFVRGAGVILGAAIIIGIGIVMTVENQQSNLKTVGFYLIFGMGILSLIQAVIVILYVRSIRYVLDEQKVAKKWGIFFKSEMGIHYEDIDYIGKKYGVIHKLFGTGNVTVNTVGSSTTDLTLHNLADTEKFYELLKERYQGGSDPTPAS